MVEDVKKELEELKKNQSELSKLDEIMKHIRLLHDTCLTIGRALISEGEFHLGRQLIINSLAHDVSKLYGFQFEYLNSETAKDDSDKFQMALRCHREVEKHHIAHWGSFEDMPRVYRIEMLADCYTRSIHQGTDIRDYIKKVAPKEWGVNIGTKAYKEMVYYLDIILGKPFKKVKEKDGSKDSKTK